MSGISRPGPRAGGCISTGRECCEEERDSGGERLADADLGDRGVGGQARPAGREARPGLGLAVAVPVAVDLDAAAGQAGQDAVPARGERGGQAGGGRAGPDGGDDRAPGGGERDLPGVHGLAGALALRAGTAIAAAARAAARASSTAVTQAACSWATRAGDCERSIGPVDGPAPLIADLASFREVSDPIHRQ